MRVREPRVRSAWLRAGIATAALLLLAGGYLLAMHLSVDRLTADADTSIEERDALYLWLHLGFFFGSAVVGLSLGKFLNGLGIAHATLFVATIASVMVFAHLGSHSLACDAGRNDVVRHWTC